MKKTASTFSGILLMFIFALAVCGQTGSSGTGSVSLSFSDGFKGRQYSAESVRETLQTLADSNKITETVKSLEYRDSEGRTRREEVSHSNPRPYSVNSISIFDPVGGYSYSLNPADKSVFRIKLGAPNQASPLSLTPPPGQTSTQERLGTRIIDGIETTGTRITTIIAPGISGNEKEIRRVFENWYSPELRLSLLTISDDPRYGVSTTRKTNIKRAEPDKSLFEIPADYKIIDRELSRPPVAAPNPLNNNESKKP